MKITNIYSIADNIKDRFQIEPDLYILVKHAADALKHTGNGILERKLEEFYVKNYQVELPCDVIWVASVVKGIPEDAYNYEDGITQPSFFLSSDSSASENRDENLIPTSLYINYKRNYIPQQKGQWVEYVWRDPFLMFNQSEFYVHVEYIKTATDEEGYPLIPETAEEACMYNYLYYHYFPQFISGKMNINIWKEIEEMRRRKLAQAINLKGLSRNELSKIFDSIATFDRKNYNKDI